MSRLTVQELGVLRLLLVNGATTRQIADQLNVTIEQVKSYMRDLVTKIRDQQHSLTIRQQLHLNELNIEPKSVYIN